MKKLLVGLLVLGSVSSFANVSPDSFSFKSIVRNNDGSVLIKSPRVILNKKKMNISKHSKADTLCQKFGFDRFVDVGFETFRSSRSAATINEQGEVTYIRKGKCSRSSYIEIGNVRFFSKVKCKDSIKQIMCE